TLRAELFASFAPFGDVELGFLACRERLSLRFSCGGDGAPRTGQLAVQFANAFGSGIEFSAERRDFLVSFLELQEQRNYRMHGGSLARNAELNQGRKEVKKKARGSNQGMEPQFRSRFADSSLLPPSAAEQRRLRSSRLGVRFAACDGEIEQVADSDRKRDEAERSSGPGFRFVHDPGDYAEGGHEADGAADQENSVFAGTSGRRNFFRKRNGHSTRDGRHALI